MIGIAKEIFSKQENKGLCFFFFFGPESIGGSWRIVA